MSQLPQQHRTVQGRYSTSCIHVMQRSLVSVLSFSSAASSSLHHSVFIVPPGRRCLVNRPTVQESTVESWRCHQQHAAACVSCLQCRCSRSSDQRSDRTPLQAVHSHVSDALDLHPVSHTHTSASITSSHYTSINSISIISDSASITDVCILQKTATSEYKCINSETTRRRVLPIYHMGNSQN